MSTQPTSFGGGFSSSGSSFGLVGPILNFLGGRRDLEFNRSQANRNRSFQRMMAQHQYRYAVNDMRLAGINPILGFGQGGGAPMASGAMAQHSGGESAGSTALEAMKVADTIAQIRATTRNIDQNTEVAKSQEKLNETLEKKADAEEKLTKVNTARGVEEIPKAQTWGDVWSRLGKYASDAMDTAEGGVETLKRTYKDAVDWLNQKFSKPSTAKQHSRGK